jgi:hypothetical protein
VCGFLILILIYFVNEDITRIHINLRLWLPLPSL